MKEERKKKKTKFVRLDDKRKIYKKCANLNEGKMNKKVLVWKHKNSNR